MTIDAVFDFFDAIGTVLGRLLRAGWAAVRGFWERLLDAMAPRRTPIGLAAAALLIVSTLLPWATFSGFAGKMTLAFYPGGARLYVLVLGLAAVLLVVPVAGRRGAGLWTSIGALAASAITVVAIAVDGGGLVNVGIGGYLAVVAAAVLLVAFASLPADVEPVVSRRRFPRAAESLLIAVTLGVGLFAVVEGLRVEDASQFLSFLALVVGVMVLLSRLGATSWLLAAFQRNRTVTLSAGLLTAVAFPFTQNGDAYWLRVFATIGVFAAAAVGLNVVVGLAGLLDLGYIAFFGVGAYVGGIFGNAGLTSFPGLHWPFPLKMLLGAVIAAIFGVIIGAPTLRLRGDYLAIVTLAFGEIFRIAANNLDGTAGPNITRGPNGIARIPAIEFGDFNFGESHTLFGIPLPSFANYYFLELLLLVFVILTFVRLNSSRIGRAWVAIREDETAASAMGVNTVRLKLLAFALGAFLAGAAGTINAHIGSQVSPESYTFLESIFLLAAVVLGGMGTVSGAILGYAVLYILPEKLRGVQEYRLLIFGLALVLIMRFRPEGIIANRRRQREFHDHDAGADALSAPPGGPVTSV